MFEKVVVCSIWLILLSVTSNSQKFANFPVTIDDLCIDLYSEKFTTKPSDSKIPFNISSTILPTSDQSELNINLKITDKEGNRFATLRAFLIRARTDKNHNREEIIGKFIINNSSDTSVNYHKCFTRYYGSQNLAYRNLEKLADYSVDLTWSGPNAKGLVFEMLLLQDSKNYWINVVEKIPSTSLISYDSITNYEQITNYADTDQNTFGCGQTKGCIFWPRFRRGVEGSYGFVAYKRYNKYIKFELSMKQLNELSNEYVKLTFIDLDEHRTKATSNDNSLTVSCGLPNGAPNIEFGYYNISQYKRLPISMNNIIKNARVYRVVERGNAYLKCKFYLKTTIDVNTEVPDFYKYDLTVKNYRFALSNGEYYKDTDIRLETKVYPFVTDKRVDINVNELHFGSAFTFSIKLHIILEIFAWILFNQLALFINAYFSYGEFFEKETLCNTIPRFSLIYKVLTFIVLFISWGGLVMLFAHYDNYKLKVNDTHHILGMITLGLTSVQCIYIIICAFFKQNPKGWMHKIGILFGWLGTLFSILTMFYGVHLPQINNLFHTDFVIILSFYTVFEVIKLIIFQIIDSKRKHYIRETHKDRKIFRNPNAPGYLLLYISILELFGCCVAISYFVIMY